MTIIEQLEQSVSLPILGAEQSIAHISLLEQFYALLIARLSSAKVYTQLMQASYQLDPAALANSSNLASNTVGLSEPLTALKSLTTNLADSSLFVQLWPDENQRQLIIDELVATHHIDNNATIELITSATTLAYHELKELAKGQFLPAFLQQQQAQIRHYLPVWAESVLIDNVNSDVNDNVTSNTNNAVTTSSVDLAFADEVDTSDVVLMNKATDKIDLENKAVVINAADPEIVAIAAVPVTHANYVNNSNEELSAPHIPIDDSGHDISQINNTRQRNKRNDLLLRLCLLLVAVAALALLWWFVIRPNYSDGAEPVVVQPAAVVVDTEPVALLAPAELLVAVDNSGSLYTCSATVGDSALQQGLNQALTMSFGEQASICELTLQAGVATDLGTINVGLLPSYFTLLRSAPFARLQLQNNIITIDSPNDELSQRLLMDMRALSPTSTITTSAPLASIGNNTMTDADRLAAEALAMNNNFDEQNSEQSNDNFAYQPQANNNFNNGDNSSDGSNGSNSNSSNSSYTGNGSDTSSNSNSNNGVNSNLNNSNLNNNGMANDRPIGGMSAAEADALANNIIVNEQLRNESRVQPNVANQ